ncbi:unnamed protein product [Blepharisma stoltei]|uniref:Uncharacterized protein n=1 Tax=Blepharisma stoltei TaxID=1481888 RepID=A0AAU9IZZ3_9CILI|nr:unnamed protein product [Blepharisma stoltei]
MSVKLEHLTIQKSPKLRTKRVDDILSSIDTLQKDLKNIKKEPFKSSSIGTLEVLTQATTLKKKPTFNRSNTYLKGKDRIELIKNKEEAEKRKQKEKNALQIIYGDTPQHKRYMTQEIFTDKEVYRIVQNNKRKFGPDRTKSKLNIQFFETPKANYQFKRGREKVVAKEEVTKGLNSIYFNHTYRNSPRMQKKHLIKQIEESKFKTFSSLSLPECFSPSSPAESCGKKSVDEEFAFCTQNAFQSLIKESERIKLKPFDNMKPKRRLGILK